MGGAQSPSSYANMGATEEYMKNYMRNIAETIQKEKQNEDPAKKSRKDPIILSPLFVTR